MHMQGLDGVVAEVGNHCFGLHIHMVGAGRVRIRRVVAEADWYRTL